MDQKSIGNLISEIHRQNVYSAGKTIAVKGAMTPELIGATCWPCVPPQPPTPHPLHILDTPLEPQIIYSIAGLRSTVGSIDLIAVRACQDQCSTQCMQE